MEKPYYKSQLRLQKRKSSINSHIYKYKYKSFIVSIRVIIEDNFNKLVIIAYHQGDNIKFCSLEEKTNIYKLNIKRILAQYPTGQMIMIRSNWLLTHLSETLLQCGFVLQYTKELGYHFIR